MQRIKLRNTEERQYDVILYVYLTKEVRLYDTSMPMDVYGWLHKRGTLAGATPQTELIFVHLASQGLDPWTCNEKLQGNRSCFSVCIEFWNICTFCSVAVCQSKLGPISCVYFVSFRNASGFCLLYF